ncbi:uncharacterized protein LOC135847851 [Planococcus citri]|uniref:uncharacterized protein LOC135847851 n=1 Tax=Planococcus citri TaxID=170843 RepID=UPI0031F880AB
MVLPFKLFFFASIPCCAFLGTGSSPSKFGYLEIVESIEQKLKHCSNDKERADILLRNLIDARLSNCIQSAVHNAVQNVVQSAVQPVVNTLVEKVKEHNIELDHLKRVNEVSEPLFCAWLTCQALANLEMNAFPPVLYHNPNLTRYTKWELALVLYRTPVLNVTRAALDESALTPGQFAFAVNSLHSLFSVQFPRPQLLKYRLPRTRASIEKFCSFVNDLKLGAFLSEDQLSDEQRETVVNSYRGAAHLACRTAFTYTELLTDPKHEQEIMKVGADRFSAVIIIRNANLSDEQTAEGFLKTLLEEAEFKSNVEKKQVERMPLEQRYFKDTNAEKVLDEFDLVFHFVCKYIPSTSTIKYVSGEQDNYGLRIQKRLQALFSKPRKSIVLLPSITAYLLLE